MKQILVICGLIVAAFFAGNTLYIQSSKIVTPQVKGITQETISLSTKEFSNMLNSGEYILLDIRTREEYAAGHINNSQQIDYYQTQAFSNYLDTLDKNKKYLIYCRSGNRSNTALNLMQRKGFKHVYELSGGYNAWVAAGLPIAQ